MNNIHAERVETLVVVVCSPFAIPPHRATALFSVSPQLLLTEPPLSSPHHPHLLPSPHQAATLYPCRSTRHRRARQPGSNLSRTHCILVVGCGFSSLTMYDGKEKLCFFSFDIHRDLNLAGFVPLFD
ncbi:hypothetical protein Bca4012_051607 [Brassica carinata]